MKKRKIFTIERDIVACQVLLVRLGAQVNASQFLSINGIISLSFENNCLGES